MKPPKISIVIPSFNKVRFIRETLDSIVSQKYSNLEVIIQDGGSSDGTLEIIKKYALKFLEIIRYESKKDNGQLDAINKGLGKATGEILTFINADDCYLPGAFAAISEAYIRHRNALWFAGQGRVINLSGEEIAKVVTWYKNLFLTFNFYFFLLTLNYLMQPSVFITRKAWQKFGPFTGITDFITEYDLWLKMGRVSMPIIINRNISNFRIERTTKTKIMSNELLSEDWRIVNKYTKNPFVLVLHKLNNLGRAFVGRFV
jgi:glycosyltransferase involved in cell wall biosynthesis